METQEAKQIIDSALTAFELRTVERLRKAEDILADKVRTAEVKLQALQQLAWAIGAVAVIFGGSGAWGWHTLSTVQTQLDAANDQVKHLANDVGVLRANTSTFQSAVDSGVDRLQRAAAQQIEQFRQGARSDADTSISAFRDRLAALSSATNVRANSIQIVNASGKPVISLSAGNAGGVIEVFNSTTSNEVGKFGTDDDGLGSFLLSNSAGQVLFQSHLSGNGGSLFLNNASSGQTLVQVGADSTGDYGGIWLSNQSGNTLALGEATVSGGVWQTYSADKIQLVGALGASEEGDGHVWLWDKTGKLK